jgi:hypothetical protein
VKEIEGKWNPKVFQSTQDHQICSSTRPKTTLTRSGTDLSQVQDVVSRFEASKLWLDISPTMSDVENEFEKNTRAWTEAQSGRRVNPDANEEGDESDFDDKIFTAESLEEVLVERACLIPTNTPKDAIKFIKDQLDENYRAQAELLGRPKRSSSGRAPPRPCGRSFSTPAITRSQSNDQLLGDNNRSPPPTTSFYTPPRPIPNRPVVLRATSLVSLVSQHRTSSVRKRFDVEVQPKPTEPVKESGEAPTGKGTPIHATYLHKLDIVPSGADPFISKRKARRSSKEVARGPLYFTEEEHQHIADKALANVARANIKGCNNTDHTCQSCVDFQLAYLQNKAMPTSIPPEERQKIINNNRSLRNIKNVWNPT